MVCKDCDVTYTDRCCSVEIGCKMCNDFANDLRSSEQIEPSEHSDFCDVGLFACVSSELEALKCAHDRSWH